MSDWLCAIHGCLEPFEDVESLIAHQVDDHEYHECRVCGEIVPEGFFALRHAFDDHTRAEYVRHYDADSDAIRWRETIKDTVEGSVDLAALEKEIFSQSDTVRVEAAE
jgi:hypothetical protein